MAPGQRVKRRRTPNRCRWALSPRAARIAAARLRRPFENAARFREEASPAWVSSTRAAGDETTPHVELGFQCAILRQRRLRMRAVLPRG